MSGLGINTGLKALLSARFSLDTIGNNLANANTPGYSRQNVSRSSSSPLRSGGVLVGSGVDITSVERSIDELLNRRAVSQSGILGSLLSRNTGLSELEGFLGDSQTGSVGSLLEDFFTGINDLSSAPTDSILRSGLVQAADSLSARLRETAGGLSVTSRGTEQEIRSRVQQVNASAQEVASLNQQIASSVTSGVTPNDLMDRRDVLVTELSELAGVTTVPGNNGVISVLVSGSTLVSGSRAVPMSTDRNEQGEFGIQLGASNNFITVQGGAIGGSLQLLRNDIPQLGSEFDQLAKSLILSVNRLHSTGVPSDGGFTQLTSSNAVKDFDGDGKASDELLSNSGLPFPVVDGGLYVNLENQDTGELETTRINIRASRTTVDDFLGELNKISGLNADLDASGRIRIASDSPYTFDFSNRLPSQGEGADSFGGAQASVVLDAGPYNLSDGQTLQLADSLGALTTVTFNSADFKEISQASAAEIADVINASGASVVADSVNGSLSLQSGQSGAAASFSVVGGTAQSAGALDVDLGAYVGSSTAVNPTISGSYNGDDKQSYTFRPTSDGTIGTTPQLSVEVLDSDGKRVALLDVGSNYIPGTEIDVADGIKVSFGVGDLSVDDGDQFSLDLIPDSDSADVLVALGLNGFYEGTGASDISVSQRILDDPTRLSSSKSGASGDSQLLLDLLAVKNEGQDELGGDSLGQYYGDIVGELGFAAASNGTAIQAGLAVAQSLDLQRGQVSGVDVDEELVDLVAFEQAFQAASRYITVVNELSDELLNLL